MQLSSLPVLLLASIGVVVSSRVPSTDTVAAQPKFYLQVINGTHSGSFITTKIDPYTGYLDYTDSFEAAAVFTFLQNGTVRALGLANGDIIWTQTGYNPDAIYVAPKHHGYLYLRENINVTLPRWDKGDEVGTISPTGTFTQWIGCSGIEVSSIENGDCPEAWQYIKKTGM